jgi:hypothetical protein
MSYMSDDQRFAQYREQFKDHEVTFDGYKGSYGNFKFLRFKKPGTYIDSLYYVIHGHYLMVYGDQGDGIYAWSGEIDFDFLAGCDLYYFASKCQAHEDGRGGKNWDPEECERYFRSYLKDREVVCLDKRHNHEAADPVMDIDACIQYVRDELNLGGFDKWEWTQFVSDNHDFEIDIAGHRISISDFWESGYGMGERISWRTTAHLIGLKMAMEKVNDAKQMAQVNNDNSAR